MDVADACHALGIKAVAVTAGYMNPAPRADFYRHIDAANVDLKGFTDALYADLCAAHLAPVLDTLRYLVQETVKASTNRILRRTSRWHRARHDLARSSPCSRGAARPHPGGDAPADGRGATGA